jgi:hypothetical protein
VFVRKKRDYYYVVKSYREGGQVRQRVLAYLGRSPSLTDAREYHAQQEWFWKTKRPKDIDESLEYSRREEYHLQQQFKLERLMKRMEREKGS